MAGVLGVVIAFGCFILGYIFGWNQCNKDWEDDTWHDWKD